jgi:TDG/mug DNA glycosylase family protein
MDRQTVETYEQGADTYATQRRAYHPDRAERFAATVEEGAWRLDLGSGPGHYLPYLGRPVVAADPAAAMVATALSLHGEPGVAGVVCEAGALPFRRGAIGGMWASKSLQHIPAENLPLVLRELHRVLPVGGTLDLTLFRGEGAEVVDDDEFTGRLFTWWEPDALERLLVGAGFAVTDVDVGAGDPTADRHPRFALAARRERTLADTVGPGMRMLICGLNPSLYAADAGVAFARPGNRFWPAARAAGLVSVDRDPGAALAVDGVGMTDLVKRATVAAAELDPAEYRAGLDRLTHLVGWLHPRVVCFVGLAGWRAAVDRKAHPGAQPAPLADTPVYVMPSTSGLNARVPLAALTHHLEAAAALGDQHG